jgi:multidrug efflux pump subunit AcrA (membrane-fusion protein)
MQVMSYQATRYVLPCGVVLGLLTLVGAGGEQADRPPVSGPPSASSVAQSKDHVVQLKQCLVSLIHDVEVPAREAGVLVKIDVREGQEIKVDQQVAQIDDERAKAQQVVAQHQLKHAQATATNDVNVRYAKAAAKVSEAELTAAQSLNQLSPGTISVAEIRRLDLALKHATLAIEQAENDQHLSDLASHVRSAELKAAEIDVRRRAIFAPVAGTVVEILKKPGEWLQAGEAVLRIVQLERLRVEGFVQAEQVGGEELADRPVTVSVRRQRGQTAQFAGKIVFVNPIIEASGNYRVWAEVDNRRKAGHWLLQPGMEAQMTIELKTPPGPVTTQLP